MKYFAVILGIFGLELKIKSHVEKTFSDRKEKKMCAGLVALTKYHNKGAFLDLGQKRSSLVAALSLLLAVGATVLWVITLGKSGKSLLKWSLTLLLGGAWSNTYDRLARKYVVDYFRFPRLPGRFKNVIFNISDFCILLGAALTVVSGEAEGE